MATRYVYIKNTGTAVNLDGVYSSPLSGSWASAFANTGLYYSSIDTARTQIAAAGSLDQDIIYLVSDEHSTTSTLGDARCVVIAVDNDDVNAYSILNTFRSITSYTYAYGLYTTQTTYADYIPVVGNLFSSADMYRRMPTLTEKCRIPRRDWNILPTAINCDFDLRDSQNYPNVYDDVYINNNFLFGCKSSDYVYQSSYTNYSNLPCIDITYLKDFSIVVGCSFEEYLSTASPRYVLNPPNSSVTLGLGNWGKASVILGGSTFLPKEYAAGVLETDPVSFSDRKDFANFTFCDGTIPNRVHSYNEHDVNFYTLGTSALSLCSIEATTAVARQEGSSFFGTAKYSLKLGIGSTLDYNTAMCPEMIPVCSFWDDFSTAKTYTFHLLPFAEGYDLKEGDAWLEIYYTGNSTGNFLPKLARSHPLVVPFSGDPLPSSSSLWRTSYIGEGNVKDYRMVANSKKLSVTTSAGGFYGPARVFLRCYVRPDKGVGYICPYPDLG